MQLILSCYSIFNVLFVLLTVSIRAQPLTARLNPRHFHYGTCADYMLILATLTQLLRVVRPNIFLPPSTCGFTPPSGDSRWRLSLSLFWDLGHSYRNLPLFVLT